MVKLNLKEKKNEAERVNDKRDDKYIRHNTMKKSKKL